MVEHGEGRRISAQPESDRISGPDRHLAAVTRRATHQVWRNALADNLARQGRS